VVSTISILIASLTPVSSVPLVPITPTTPEDTWETDINPYLKNPPCTFTSEVDESFVKPVVAAARAEATARLEQISAVELADSEAARFAGLPTTGQQAGTFATIIAADAVASAEEEKRKALAAHVGSWSENDAERLNELKELLSSGNISKLKPFLVRAVAKDHAIVRYESGFSVLVCGGSLVVMYFSQRDPPFAAQRQPLVLLLEKKPDKVFVYRAE